MANNICSLSVFIILTLSVTSAVKPGVKSRITKKGIDFANAVAQAALNKELKNLQIPNQGGSDGHISYSLTNIKNKGVTVPTSHMTFDPTHNGLAWSLTNLGLKLDADWRVKYKKGWIKISDSGSVTVEVKGASVSVSIALGVDKAGRPSVSTASCNGQINDVDVHFHGGQAFILNLFRHTVEHKIKDALKPQICKIITKEVNVDAEAKVAKLPVTVEMAHRFLLNYQLVAKPKVSSNYLDVGLKGEVYWEKDIKEAPFVPATLPEPTHADKMLYIWVTQYTGNSYTHSAQTHNFLKYNFTAADLPAGNRSILNTTCHGTMCIGQLIPQIGKAVPNAVISIFANSTRTPLLNITPKAAVLSTQINLDMYATMANKTKIYLMTLNMTLSFALKANVVKERLIAQIISHSFHVDVVKSNIGKINPRGLNIVLGIAVDSAVIPRLNKLAEKGFALPVTDDINFANTSLEFLNGALLISTDVTSAKLDQSLKFVSEGHRQ